MDRATLMGIFNKQPRIGTLSTVNRNGEPNVAVFGSPYMVDENTVVMGIGENRSFRNLRENPRAVFIVVEPGNTVFDWKGARVYLEALEIETGGGFFNQVKEDISKAVGADAAKMIHAAIRFRITEVRAIVDVP